MLGVASSRNFYVPIDVGQPINRMCTIIESIAPEMVISIGNVPQELVDRNICDVCEYAELIETKRDDKLIEQIQSTCIDTDPLYCICTSGSTGVPKGVLISHRSVEDFIPTFTETFGFGSDEVFGNQAPFDFDVSVKDIYSALFLGATVYIIPRKCFSMPKLLLAQLEEQKISTIIWAVSAICIVATVNGFKHGAPSHLKNVLFSGETMPIKMLNVWRKALPDARFVNLYGPTEITCNCTYYVVDREFEASERLPLGVPFKNEEVLVLGEDNKPVKPGERGEICVLGTCLALGYYRNPDRTAASFVQNPLNDAYPELMYRTGDLADYASDGQYYYTARKDFQIKHMGHRIELEEIELHLNACECVTRACCLFDEQRNKIVAHYEGQGDQKEIVIALREDLPKYMIPNVFVKVNQLPLTKNGKIDRKALSERYFADRG